MPIDSILPHAILQKCMIPVCWDPNYWQSLCGRCNNAQIDHMHLCQSSIEKHSHWVHMHSVGDDCRIECRSPVKTKGQVYHWRHVYFNYIQVKVMLLPNIFCHNQPFDTEI